MKHTYHVNGIKCASCVAKIIDAIKKEFFVTDIEITKNKTLTFDSPNKVELSTLNSLLSKTGDYSAVEDTSNKEDQSSTSYTPIYIIFGYLILISILLNLKNLSVYLLMADFMAGFFLVFSFFKMLDLSGFSAGYANYDIIAKKFPFYGYVYPFIELGFGLSYLVFPMNFWLNFVVFVVMSLSTVGVIQSKVSKRKFYCACVGTFLKVPLGNIAIIENILMVVMSLLMLLLNPL